MQVVEAIELTEGTTPICIDTHRGIRIMIVGHGCIGGLVTRHIPEPDIIDIAYEATKRGEELSIMANSVASGACVFDTTQYTGEMKLDISKDDFDKLKAAYEAYGDSSKSVYEVTCDYIFDNMKIDYALLDTSDRISKHPQWMNNQRLKYKAPDRRCEVVRRGKREGTPPLRSSP